MKIPPSLLPFGLRRVWPPLLLALTAWVRVAHAGLTVDLHIYRDQNHTVYGWLGTNSVPPAAPLGNYLIRSPHSPTNGSYLRYSHTPGSFILLDGSGSGTDNFNAFMSALTNGPWTIQVTNATSTNIYTFNVSAPGLTSNLLNQVNITYPMAGDTNVPVNPTFTWEGRPGAWQGTLDVEVYDELFSHYESDTIPPTETSWTSPTALPVGTNEFYVTYRSNATDTIVASTPTNGVGSPISGWVSTANIEIPDSVSFVTRYGAAASANGLVAHYRFDNPGVLGFDSSNNGYDLNVGGSWNGGDVFDTTDAVAGGGAVEFYTDSGNGGGFLSYNPTPPELLSVLSSNFSISLWLKTSQSFGNSGDDAFNGAGIVSADVDGLDYDVLPVALTEGEVAFNTGGDVEYTVNSTTTVNDGDYHHIVVTRDQGTGEKKIYIDGALNTSEFDSADVLDAPVLLTLGGIMDASVSNPETAGPYNGYEGLLDDLQIYSKVLSSNQVAYLFDNPGEVAPADGGQTNGPSTGHTNIGHYRFDLGNDLGHDSSPANNHFNGSSTWGLPVHYQTNLPAAGDAAAYFTGNSSISVFSGNTVFTNLQTVLAGSCSVSLWLKTTNAVGSNDSDAVNGASVVWLYDNPNGIIPVAVTGSKVAFYTGDAGDTLHSSNNVTDGNYHHVVVTRDQATGEKKIYVDGVLDATGTGSTALLNGNNNSLTFGGASFTAYKGLLDDVQIYSGVLSATEVTNLFSNPGTVAPDTTGDNTNPPVDVVMQIGIIRNQPINGNDEYYCVPKLNSVNITEITEHRVESPTAKFSGTLTGWSSHNMLSLESLLSECTHTNLWKIYINPGDPGEQVFKFSVMTNGLDTNILKRVTILSPTNGSTGVSTSSAFTWSGPVGFLQIFAQKYELPFSNAVFTNQPGTATNWPSPPTLNPGTNRLYLSYHSNNISLITFTTPVDGLSMPLNSWSVTAYMNSDATAQFIVSALPSPVQILGAQRNGTNFQFQFLSQAGTTNLVQSRTNVATGTWQDRTNILGDGTLKTILLPIGPSPREFFRVLTQ